MEFKNADSVTNDSYFTNLEKEDTFILFASNLQYARNKDRKFTTAIHKKNTNKYLVTNLQDKGHVDEEKLNNYD